MAKLEAQIYTQDGKKKDTVSLPENIFGCPWNADLVHQVVVSQASNLRRGTAHAKDRGDVRGGGRKPWRQKGTGRARHGSRRSPIWVGGGVTHGPRAEKRYNKKINTKMRSGALRALLSQKYRDGEVLFVDSLGFSEPKTAEAKKVLQSLSGIKGFEDLATKKHNAALVAFGQRNENALKSFKNMGNIDATEITNVSAHHLVQSKYLIIIEPEESVTFLASKK